MRRGEIWAAAGAGYAGKPRPSVILQDDRFEATGSVTVCGFTTSPREASFFRVVIEPSSQNGLREPSRVMVDKIMTLPRARLSYKIGQLDDEDMARVNDAALVFLGLSS